MFKPYIKIAVIAILKLSVLPFVILSLNTSIFFVTTVIILINNSSRKEQKNLKFNQEFLCYDFVLQLHYVF